MQKLRHYKEDINNINLICKKSGISLVEIIVALLVLALAALPAVGTFSTYYSTSTKQMEQEMALKIAESVVNLMNTVSYDMILDKTLSNVPLDIQTPDGTIQGNLIFKDVNDPRIVGLSADGKTPSNNKLFLRGTCEDIQINRIKYKVDVDVIKAFRSQNLTLAHDEAMNFYYYDYSASETQKYDSFDDAFIFDVTVTFGKTKPIKLSSFRADMVK